MHISDLHLKAELDTWGQNVFLRELIRDVASRIKGALKPEFVIISGDLAFSGSESEYRLVEEFLDELRNIWL